jgi:uncharacterized protein (DUF1697 family)
MYVAFLRGINVGGKNMLPMKDLAAMFVAAGCEDVRTFIQSGNVVWTARPPIARKVPAAIEAAITRRFGYRIPVVMRTAAALSEVAHGNPFLKAGADPDTLHVGFLSLVPGAEQVAGLDPRRSPPDEFVVRGPDIYLRFPNGVGKTKFTNAYLDAKLRCTSTVRNWRTVLALVALTGT